MVKKGQDEVEGTDRYIMYNYISHVRFGDFYQKGDKKSSKRLKQGKK